MPTPFSCRAWKSRKACREGPASRMDRSVTVVTSGTFPKPTGNFVPYLITLSLRCSPQGQGLPSGWPGPAAFGYLAIVRVPP